MCHATNDTRLQRSQHKLKGPGEGKLKMSVFLQQGCERETVSQSKHEPAFCVLVRVCVHVLGCLYKGSKGRVLVEIKSP